MDQREIIEKIKSGFGGEVGEVLVKNKRRCYIYCDSENGYLLCRYIFDELGGRLATATGIDGRRGIEILYHFSFDRDNCIITVKVLAEKPELCVKSLSPFIPGAEWIEREIHELLGVNFEGHPNLKPLILAEDWPEGRYPLRRDYVNEKESGES